MTHILLRSAADQVDYIFATYKVRGEGLYCKVDDLVTYLIVTWDDETSVATAECVMHRKGLQATVKFILNVRWVNGITST